MADRPDLSDIEEQALDEAVNDQAQEVFRWPLLDDATAVLEAWTRLQALSIAELADLEMPPKRYLERMAEIIGPESQRLLNSLQLQANQSPE